MSKTQYQDFGEGGDSNSQKKLGELKMPDDMTGMRVLDIGCNAGFFSIEAAKRGATAVGIETRKDYWNDAQENAKAAGVADKCTFFNGGWADIIPKMKDNFDYVFWLAAMHYEPRPAMIVKHLKRMMNPDGKIILDVGLSPDYFNASSWGKLPRPGNMESYPNYEMLENIFSGFALRNMGASTSLANQGTRLIFHATVRKPVVVLIEGWTETGKTALATLISEGAVKITCDGLFAALEREPAENSEFGEMLAAFQEREGTLLNAQAKLVRHIRDIEKPEYLERLIEMLLHHINPDFPLYIVEGGFFTIKGVKEIVMKQLGSGYKIWNCVKIN